MKPARLHPAAEIELIAEAQYYEEHAPGLGERFLAEIEAAVALISRYPRSGSPHLFGTRRVFARRFPFAVVYLDRAHDVAVVAIAPFPRRPTYWRDRVEGTA